MFKDSRYEGQAARMHIERILIRTESCLSIIQNMYGSKKHIEESLDIQTYRKQAQKGNLQNLYDRNIEAQETIINTCKAARQIVKKIEHMENFKKH